MNRLLHVCMHGCVISVNSPSIPIVLLWQIRLLLHQDTIHTIQSAKNYQSLI
jgi:hypothetical protein